MADRGSSVGQETATYPEIGWSFVSIDPSLSIVANYKTGLDEFTVPVVGYLMLMVEGEDGEDLPVWVAAVLDESTGRVYSPADDSNFVNFTVEIAVE